MKFFIQLSFILTLGLLTSQCKKESHNHSANVGTNRTLKVSFVTDYGTDPIEFEKTYPFGPIAKIRFTRLSSFFSNLELKPSDGSAAIPVKDVVFANFGDPSGLSSKSQKVTFTFQVPDGTYSQFNFGIGLPPEINGKIPADFPAGSPLANTADYWASWDSYIFSKFEGRLDTLGNGVFGNLFTYHTGLNEAYMKRSLTKSGDFHIHDDKQEILVKIDVLDMFQKLDAASPIRWHSVAHGPKDALVNMAVANSFRNAIFLVP
jgi:hypothetical protein